MLFPKPQTIRDPKYLAWLRTQPCAFCSHPPPSEASHHGRHGMALKPSDHLAVPACRGCHHRHHTKGSPAPRYDAMTQDERRDAYEAIARRHRSRYLLLSGGR
jgi:cytochrome c553